MEKIKYKFKQFILNNGIDNFDKFEKCMTSLSNDEKGKYMEYLCYLFFKLNPYHSTDDIWLYDDIPISIKKYLKLPKKDKGIDALRLKNNVYYAIQVKFRSDRETIQFGELSTFPALTFGTNVTSIHRGLMFSNCIDVCYELKGDKYINICYADLYDFCDTNFWNNCISYIGSKPVITYQKKSPYPHQVAILKEIKDYYQSNKYGRLYMPCGTGKSLVGYWTFKDMDFNTCFICVPSLYLLNQIYVEWMTEFIANSDDTEFLLIGSDMDNNGEDNMNKYIITTDSNIIEKYILNNQQQKIVITTYDSSILLADVLKNNNIVFDLAIYDEAHITTGKDGQKFNKILKYKVSDYRLFMTATEKIFDSNTNSKILSMDDESIYGKIIYAYSTRMAIDGEQLCDYVIIAGILPSDMKKDLESKYYDFKDFDNFPSNIVFGSIFILYYFSKGDVHHLIAFCNKNERASEMEKCINSLIKKYYPELSDLYVKALSCNDSMNYRKFYVNEFEKAERGILINARILGLGANIVTCDSICFVDNRESTINIIQCFSRPLRICSKLPNKKAKILLPIILDDKEDNILDSNNASFKNIRNILKSLATTDEQITEKIYITNHISKIVKKDVKTKSNIILSGDEIKIDEFRDKLMLKIFDKWGNDDNYLKRLLNHQNNIRYCNNNDLIDTKNKCEKFLLEKGYRLNDYLNKIEEQKNFVKFALGNKIFDKIKEKYVKSIDEFIDICHQSEIYDIDAYKLNFHQNSKLPSMDYINNGFMEEIKPNFNLMKTLEIDDCNELDF